jgi:ribonuclease III
MTRTVTIPGIVLSDGQLLQIALTHRSFCKEHPERAGHLPSNERMEFLGDAVLNMVASEWLYQRFPESSEGDLSLLRSALVRMKTLARFAREFNLGDYARLSRNEENRNGRNRDALLADLFEAVLGALYLDRGLDAVRAFLAPLFERETARVLAGEADVDYRTLLQQTLQAEQGESPTYRTIDEHGPPHAPQFTVEVLCGEVCLGVGKGSSKQLASQEAARVALEMLSKG